MSFVMASPIGVVAFVENGRASDTFSALVHQACQDQKILPPVLRLEFDTVRYRLFRSAAKGTAGSASRCWWLRSMPTNQTIEYVCMPQMHLPMAMHCRLSNGRPIHQVM